MLGCDVRTSFLDLFLVLNKILGEEGQEERMTEDERERRKEELRKEREEQGLPVDDDALDAVIDQEEKDKGRQRRRVIIPAQCVA